jgi:hypothetical protein
MKRIALRYSDTKLSPLTFDDEATNQVKYETIKLSDLIPVLTKENGKMLSGRSYSHTLYSHFLLDLTISSNEIDNTNFTFLKNYFAAKFKYISLLNVESSSGIFTDYKQVFIDEDKFPLSYVEDIKYLREVSFNFRIDNLG